MYYIETKDFGYNSTEVRKFIGVDPTKFNNLDMLNTVGVYPVSYPNPLTMSMKTFNDVVTSYVINGNYAEATYTLTLKSLSDVQTKAKEILKQKFVIDIGGSTVGDIDTLNTQLQADLTAVDNATDAQEVVNLIPASTLEAVY